MKKGYNTCKKFSTVCVSTMVFKHGCDVKKEIADNNKDSPFLTQSVSVRNYSSTTFDWVAWINQKAKE